jgi:methyl-accepting chemotaxis protein
MTGGKLNCWEFKKCGKENSCPAYPDSGRICWSKSGTFCGGEVQKGFAEKKDNCLACSFYQTLDSKYES